MQTQFQRKWFKAVKDKKSNIVAGLDPNNLEPGTNILEWCLNYMEEVSPYVAGLKINPKYFLDMDNGMEILRKIAEASKEKGLVTIFDEKLSDVGHTNNKGVEAAIGRGYESVTIAPYAGNAEAIIKFCRDSNLGDFGVFNMGLMSNSEFLKEGLEFTHKDTGLTLFESRLNESLRLGFDGLVLGATYSPENETFKRFLKIIKDESCLCLVPGVGAQGGDPEIFLKTIVDNGLDPKRFMLNVGRGLMNSENRAEKARELQKISKSFIFPTSEVSKEIKNLK